MSVVFLEVRMRSSFNTYCEKHKVLLVIFPDTIVYPRAMMIHLPYTALTNTKMSLKRGVEKSKKWKSHLNTSKQLKNCDLNNGLKIWFQIIELHVQGLKKITWTLIITGVNIICVGNNENIAIIFNYPFCCHMHISVVRIVFSSSRGWNGRQIIRACLAGASVNWSAQLFGVL